MTTQVPAGEATKAAVDFAAAHKALLADKNVQFSLPPEIPPPPPPKPSPFMESLAEALGGFFSFFGQIAVPVFWVVLALVVGAILYFIIREFTDFTFPWQRKPEEEEWEEGEWRPDASHGRALLAEADALATQGRFAEAAHLLLLRSVEDIERKKPNILLPSSTAREISVAQNLPERARGTFGLIARHVEASLFGGRDMDARGWEECRDAYGRFALAGEWQ